MILFTIKGDPKALKRHRTFRRGKLTGQYDPSQGDKADFLSIAHKYAPDKPIDVPIHLRATFIFQRPKNHYRANGQVKSQFGSQHIGRPDVDNLIKFVCDSLNGVFWRDDSLIFWVNAQKKYGDAPLTEIEISY